MDSKSKTNKALETQNPNKIQTAKIQDSKIQLESNPKDFAKLESQKISKIELESILQPKKQKNLAKQNLLSALSLLLSLWLRH